jgi:hypothetical protein
MSRVRVNLRAVFWKDKRRVYVVSSLHIVPAEGNLRKVRKL